MKVVFMGTPDFAVPALRRLIREHNVICVYTREPKPAGRGNKLNKTPISLCLNWSKTKDYTHICIHTHSFHIICIHFDQLPYTKI